MNLIDRAKNIGVGVEHIMKWLGDGGEVVDQQAAQKRAFTCINCPKNVSAGIPETAVALSIRRILEAKNKLELRVTGEKSLKSCAACGCVLRLLIWEKQDRIEPFLSEQEREELPPQCWKLEKP